MKSICKGYGCTVLLPSPGYCDKHKRTFGARKFWDELDEKKTPAMIKFYSSSIWNKVSKRHKVNNPLCVPCKKRGKTTKVEITHHDPDLAYLLANDLDPFNEKYLVSICEKCHMEELRKKRYKNKTIKKQSLLERMGW